MNLTEDYYSSKDLFRNGTPRLITIIFVMEKYIKKHYPDLHRHFKEQDIQLLACFTQYFITLFLYDTPIHIGIKIFDLFLLEGERVLFKLLYRMLGIKMNIILNLESQELYIYLRKRLVKECFEEFNLSTLLTSERQEEHEMESLE